MNSWETEYQRRLAVVFKNVNGKDPAGTIEIENEKGYGGYCDTCEYTYEFIVLRDAMGSKAELSSYEDFGDLIKLLAAVEPLP